MRESEIKKGKIRERERGLTMRWLQSCGGSLRSSCFIVVAIIHSSMDRSIDRSQNSKIYVHTDTYSALSDVMLGEEEEEEGYQ